MDAADTPILIYTTWPDEPSASQAAEQLLQDRLIACANLLPGAKALYRWEGQMETASEVIAVFKTGAHLAVRTEARLSELHPYETPAILRLNIEPEGSSAAYLAWLAGEIKA